VLGREGLQLRREVVEGAALFLLAHLLRVRARARARIRVRARARLGLGLGLG